MAAPPNFEEGQSMYRPPRFNGQYYGWWKTRMHDFIIAEDSELWDVICDGPFVPMKTVGGNSYSPKNKKRSAKEIYEALQTAYEGTTQVKQFKIDMLTTEYELFEMKEDEYIQDMHTRFISNINELHSLGSRESKVNAITKAKDLKKVTIDELIGNLKTYEMKRKKDLERRKPKKEKNLVLKAANRDSSSDESDMEYLTRRFQKIIRKNGGIPKKMSFSRNFEENDCCHKCGHFIKHCPLHKKNHDKTNTEKSTKRNQVPDKKFKRRDAANNMLKQALVDWGNSSSESEGENMMVVDNESLKYESIFALMPKSDDDEDKEEDEGTVKGSSLQWYMDNGCSKHMTGSTNDSPFT
ncbi:uncharacterized protein [Nicotiana sylvestris]|uniref:uncharacterized protein n=1 Tax=Nicotiana sylvestris TaxID=4096 RepID=UPI00388CD802